MGDILICIEKIEEQAKDYNHSTERELFFLKNRIYAQCQYISVIGQLAP